MQPNKFIFKTNIDNTIVIKLTSIDQQEENERKIKFHTCPCINLESFFRSISSAKIILKLRNPDGSRTDRIILDSSHEYKIDKDQIAVFFNDKIESEKEFFDLETFMCFEITLNPSVGGR